MRLFLAFLPEPELREALCRVQDELRRRGVGGRYLSPENLHMTLAFIGEYGDPDAVLEALEPLRAAPLELALEGLGAFGEAWWAGVAANERLDSLDRQLRHLLADAAVPFDRSRFIPHFTLLRHARFARDPRLGTLVVPRAEMTASRVSLMRSTPGKNEMLYTELGSVPLRDSGELF